MANALQFIESNIEDLDKEETRKKIELDFKTKLEELKLSYTNFDQIENYHSKGDMKFNEISIIGELLNKGDDKIFKKINQDVQLFIVHTQK